MYSNIIHLRCAFKIRLSFGKLFGAALQPVHENDFRTDYIKAAFEFDGDAGFTVRSFAQFPPDRPRYCCCNKIRFPLCSNKAASYVHNLHH